MASPESIQPEPTSVYRYYDHNGVLLYVGITKRGAVRNSEHNVSKEWWPYVTRQTVEHLHSRPAALRLEKRIIQQFRPPFNTVHNPDHQAFRDAYHAIRAGQNFTANPSELMKSTGGNLTLVPSQPVNGCWVLRTNAEQAGIAGRVVLDELPQSPRKHRVKRISWVEPYLFLTLGTKAELPTSAIVKVRPIQKTKPPMFRLVQLAVAA